eukprot:CAMPEP_0117608002 /NCGR_PEP_ID=MMETSP0784-20121206/80575_1 /TAXON_ID=39447 /ORGANISM="" /LENGTH=73 /DNA_ID=CAMNT_0005411245 /DNA_START=381 /DNA_END=602 /DNA_ORIENTATION=-
MSVPQMPPTPCTGNTDTASSSFHEVKAYSMSTRSAKKHMNPAPKPMSTESEGPTNPEEGVAATSPATAPPSVY